MLTEELATRIDEQLIHMIRTQETRPFADYGFLIVAGDPAAGFVQRSPLSAYPVASVIPALIGYFQVDAQEAFSTAATTGHRDCELWDLRPGTQGEAGLAGAHPAYPGQEPTVIRWAARPRRRVRP